MSVIQPTYFDRSKYLQFPQSTFILYGGLQMREKYFLEIVGSLWIEGIVRLEVDKKLLRTVSRTTLCKVLTYSRSIFFFFKILAPNGALLSYSNLFQIQSNIST